jgi:hypothetical protein
MIQNAQAVMLTATQKGILAVLHNSPTPEAAFEAINGSPALITARNLLERLGLLQVTGNKAMLTPAGRQAVVTNNIADQSGQITDDGAALIDAVNANRVAEGFELLKSLIT